MSLQSYKSGLVTEVNSGQLDPGEEARLRAAIGFVEERERADARMPGVLPPVVIPMPVDIVLVEEIIDLSGDSSPELDPSAVA